jgi:hypothetical protein
MLLTKLLLLLATAVITYRSNFTCNNYSLTEKKHNFLQAHFQYLNSARRHKKILLRPDDECGECDECSELDQCGECDECSELDQYGDCNECSELDQCGECDELVR